MLNFKQLFILSEALKIVKKASDTKELPKYDDKLNKDKPFDDIGVIGNVEGFEVVKTKHIKDVRSYETNARDAGMSNEFIIGLIKKFLKKEKNPKKAYYHLFYKDGETYNDLVVFCDDTRISIITVMQHNRKSPEDYKITKTSDLKVVLERLQPQIIYLDLTESDLY